jgi:pimeloyl-ACP methyl ester carboxylesterase
LLAGHSFGGISTGLFAQRYPQKVKALAPISTVISGELTLQTPLSSPRSLYLDKWKREGIRITSGPDGKEERLKWACMEDRLKYDLLSQADKLIMPVLLIVGSRDEQTPPEHQQILYDKLTGPKEMCIVADAGHTFDKIRERRELKRLVKAWAKRL